MINKDYWDEDKEKTWMQESRRNVSQLQPTRCKKGGKKTQDGK